MLMLVLATFNEWLSLETHWLLIKIKWFFIVFFGLLFIVVIPVSIISVIGDKIRRGEKEDELFTNNNIEDEFGIKHDPQEDDPALKNAFVSTEKQAEQNLVNHPKGLGFCHMFWREKKRILKEEHDIDWKTPEEMNPHVIFD